MRSPRTWVWMVVLLAVLAAGLLIVLSLLSAQRQGAWGSDAAVLSGGSRVFLRSRVPALFSFSPRPEGRAAGALRGGKPWIG